MERGRKLEKQIRKIRRITEWPSNEMHRVKANGKPTKKEKEYYNNRNKEKRIS